VNEEKTLLWWRGMIALALFNVALWMLVALSVDRDGTYLGWHVLFSGIFTAVCAFRSIVPRIGVQRYCMLDSMVSSMVIGRTAAMCAEVSFAAQIALLLHEAGALAGVSWVQSLAIPVVLLLSIAQLFCWSSILTLSYLGHAIEESMWAFTFILVGVALGVCGGQLDGLWQTVCHGGALCCVGYVAFMVTVDVPMYVKRWRAHQGSDSQQLGWAQGWSDALHRRVVTRDWEIWRPEVPWLTGYFSLAVWVSIALLVLPR